MIYLIGLNEYITNIDKKISIIFILENFEIYYLNIIYNYNGWNLVKYLKKI